jgi:hypothetical protein
MSDSDSYALRNTIKGILSKDRLEYEKQLSKQPHFVPLDISILNATLARKFKTSNEFSVANFRNDIIQELSAKHPYKLSSRNSSLWAGSTKISLDNVLIFTPALVYQGNEVIGALYAAKDSYSSVYSGLFRKILNKTLRKYLKRGKNSRGFDIGHTVVETDEGILAQTISTSKTSEVLTQIDSIIESGILTNEQFEYISTMVLQTTSAIESLELHSTYGTTIKESITKDFQASLLSINANIVIIQDSAENQNYGKVERELINVMRRFLPTMNFSRNIPEEIVERIKNSLLGIKTQNTKKTVHILESTSSSKKSSVKVTPIKVSPKPKILPSTNNLTSLQSLLDRHLQDVVSANMGNGSDKKVLNYRTGRLAASAKVSHLTQSRTGMISAFYTYMRNPYGTFSEGGDQQYPKSRDPKILIGNSIKEIAATLVGNRLRAVLI